MGPETLWRPGGVTAEEGDTAEAGVLMELLGELLGGVLPDAAPRRLLTPNSAESFLPNTFRLDLRKRRRLHDLCKAAQHSHGDTLEHTHLCIMANRSAVVRVLVGDRNTLSSSGLDSSLCGDAVLSLAVESVNTNQHLKKLHTCTLFSSHTFSRST